MPLSEARKRANNKYNKENSTIIACKVSKKYKEQIMEKAKKEGTTANAVIKSAIDEFMKPSDKREAPYFPVKLATPPATVLGNEITLPDAQTVNGGAGTSKETASWGGILTEYAMSKAKKAIGRTGETLPEFFERAAYKTEKNDRTTSLLGDPVKAYREDREREENPQQLHSSAQNEELKTDTESIFDLVQQVKKGFK